MRGPGEARKTDGWGGCDGRGTCGGCARRGGAREGTGRKAGMCTGCGRSSGVGMPWGAVLARRVRVGRSSEWVAWRPASHAAARMVRQPSTAPIQARIRACATSPRHARAWAIEPIAAAMPAKCWAREGGAWVMEVNIIHQC